MRKFIENTKKDLAKVKTIFTKQTKEKEVAKVIPPAGTIKAVEKNIDQEQPQPQEQTDEQPHSQAGIIIKYATEMMFEVIDEEGNKIPCKTMPEAEILSRLIELRLSFMRK